MVLLQGFMLFANPATWHGFFEFRKTRHDEDRTLVLVFDTEYQEPLNVKERQVCTTVLHIKFRLLTRF
jgi:hypothetical protein